MTGYNARIEIVADRLGLGCGVLFLLFIGSALVVFADFVPPPSPALDIESFADGFSQNMMGIRIAMILMMLSGSMYAVFYVLVAKYVSHVEGQWGVLALVMVISGIVNCVAFSLPPLFWLAAVFRLDSAVDAAYVLNTLGWFMFLGLAAPTILLMLGTAFVAFLDESLIPLFPRWFGYLNIFGATLFLPGQLIFFFYDGVFAWNGLIGFWLVAVDFFVQFVLTLYFIRAAVSRRALDTAG